MKNSFVPSSYVNCFLNKILIEELTVWQANGSDSIVEGELFRKANDTKVVGNGILIVFGMLMNIRCCYINDSSFWLLFSGSTEIVGSE